MSGRRRRCLYSAGGRCASMAQQLQKMKRLPAVTFYLRGYSVNTDKTSLGRSVNSLENV